MHIETNTDISVWKMAERLDWHTGWTVLDSCNFASGDIRWFEGGRLSVAENCLDRHLQTQPDKVAIFWESDDGENCRSITYAELHKEVCKASNALKALGVLAGDRITIYMPMIPEVTIAMLACARIGAVHSVVFAGFSPQALHDRIIDAGSKVLITADEGLRGGKKTPLKAMADEAIVGTAIEKMLVVKRTGVDIEFNRGRDVWWHEAINMASEHCELQVFDAEHPLFILYTSGSTGKPKGLVHSCGGYLVWAAYTHAAVFDLKSDDVYFCTADVGWITWHSYGVYAPLANGATSVMFEGIPNYPDPSRFWQIVDKYKVSLFYTAPTAIRSLMREGDWWLESTSRKSLRLLATAGEPINPEAWHWYYDKVGGGHCFVADTWWQTETGGIMISPLLGKTGLKAGSATLPLPSIELVLLGTNGQIIEGEGEGALCVAKPWTGLARTIHGDHERYRQTYFGAYEGYYFTGDGARRDADGYYWITGRMDDVLNVSGHRLGTAEIESALASNEMVAEAAVVAVPHDIKGEGIYAFVILSPNVDISGGNAHHIAMQLKAHVRKVISPIAMPDIIQFAPQLPKTRSGKIMRRILRKIAVGQFDQLGDISTLLNPEAVEMLVAGRHLP